MTVRDHGGGLDAAIAEFGGARADWLDLSTGINPVPYPIGDLAHDAWTALPDSAAFSNLETAARRFWNVPQDAAVLAAPGASSLIARIPRVLSGAIVNIPRPTYNEHAAAFETAGWTIEQVNADATVLVHPNNPDGRVWSADDLCAKYRIIDESFCDIAPDHSLIELAAQPNTVVLKSFGKFWGLAGLRLGFAIGDPRIITALKETLGPWQVSGPALSIGIDALNDNDWAKNTRARLSDDSKRLDGFMSVQDAKPLGGTTLFRLYDVDDANAWQARLARKHIWSRIFPYSENWLRLGLPDPNRWQQLESAF